MNTRMEIRPARVLALAIAAMLLLTTTTIGWAWGDDSDPRAAASASVAKQLKKLKKRIAALEATPAAGASGPAGGDLTGAYPSPLIGPNAISTAEIETSGVSALDLGSNSVRSDELDTVNERTGAVTAIPANDSVGANASCVAGEQAIAGGGTSNFPRVVIRAISRVDDNTFSAAYTNLDAAAHTFTPKVFCLAP
jgi:hypothetical protein